MKKWYQRCALVLVTALALQLSGCAKGSAFLSRSSRDKDDKKLVDVDTKAKKKTSSSSKKKSDKAGDSQDKTEDGNRRR
jgi:predicted component of type VI protein secretion system